MKSYSIDEYIEAGCEEMNIPAMIGVHGLSNGKVCDTGCHAFDGGNCKAYKNLIFERKAKEEPTETVRQEAERRSLSIKEVRRQRRANN